MESNAKQADENLALDDLKKATKVVALMLLDFLGAGLRATPGAPAGCPAWGLPVAPPGTNDYNVCPRLRGRRFLSASSGPEAVLPSG
jgi:hypothetical protein